jgi:hypothetical protein
MALSGLQSIAQDDFSAGMVRQVEGQRIPLSGAYDIVDGLLDDDQAVYRRGGSAYKSSAAPAALVGLADVSVFGGARTLGWTALPDMGLYVLDTDDLTPFEVAGAARLAFYARPALVGGSVAFPSVAGTDYTLYAGSRKTANYSTGTATYTADSRTVTGVGTSWLANVDKGMFFVVSLTGWGLVDSVNSDTSLTLRDPWSDVTGTSAYQLGRTTQPNTPADGPNYVASAGQRLLMTAGSRVYFSARANPRFFTDTTDYHEIPGGAACIGIEGLGNTGVVFTTGGVWAITNMAYDLTDAFGNPQQAVEKVNELILWGDPGIAQWRGSIVVPAIDDVYLMGLGAAPVPISTAIRPLYREYVQAGYKPGTAAIHRSHFLLPIINAADEWVDTLVCRLDAVSSRGELRPSWTRWANHAANSVAFAQRVGSTNREPKLFGLSDTRITDLSDCFVPAAANKNEADGTTHNLTIITRDFTTRRTGMTVWKYLRARYELTDAASDNPTLTLEYQLGPPSGSWTLVSGNAPESDGTDDYEWTPGERAQAIRFRIKSSGPAAKAVLRSLEVYYRQSGKR